MNKKLKSLIACAVTVVMTSSMLVGCSSSKSGSSDSGKTELELFSTKSENKTVLQNMIKDYEKKNPNVKITLNAPPDAGTVLKTRLTKNDIPDIIAMGGDATYTDIANAGVLVDLSSENFVDKIQKPYMDMLNQLFLKESDKVYGIPYATNADGVIYNKEIFEKLNLKVPKTWDEFMDVISKLEAAKQTPFYFTLKDAWTGMCFWNVVSSDLQPENFNKDRMDGKTTFTESYKEPAEKMVELVKHGQKDPFGVAYNDGNTAFAQGKAAMYLQGNWAISEIKKANPDIKLGMFPLPASNDEAKNKVVSGIDVLFSVSNTSKNQDEAKKFISYMLEKENAEKYITDQFAFSAVKDVMQNDETVTDLQESFKAEKIGSYPDHYYPTGLDAAPLLQAFLKDKNVDQFLKKLDTEYDKAKNQ